MDDKKIKSAVGNVVCGIFMAVGALAIFAGVVLVIAAFVEDRYTVPIPAFYAIGAGLATYAVGAVIWNLTEITINTRMILRELQREKHADAPASEKRPPANAFAKIDEPEKTLGGK